MTIIFCSAFTSQPLSMNRWPASRAAPDGPATRPASRNPPPFSRCRRRRYICQKRFTVTRAVSGLSRSTSQRPGPGGCSATPAAARQHRRHARRDLLAGRVVSAALQHEGVARRGLPAITITVGMLRDRTPRARAAAPPALRALAHRGRHRSRKQTRSLSAAQRCAARGWRRSAARYLRSGNARCLLRRQRAVIDAHVRDRRGSAGPPPAPMRNGVFG